MQLSSGDFLPIKSVFQQEQFIALSGLLLKRSSDFGGKLPRKLNEAYFVHKKTYSQYPRCNGLKLYATLRSVLAKILGKDFPNDKITGNQKSNYKNYRK